VGFEVIPAIDVTAGRLGRMGADGPEPVEEFGADPVAAARSFVDAGARWLQVVDMDLAFHEEARNLGIVGRVAALGARVQASGGVAREPDARAMLDAGAERVVLGSAALLDLDLIARLAEELGERLAAGIELEGGRVRPRGRPDVDLTLEEALGVVATAGTARLVVTAVERVSGLGGPDLDALRGIAGAAGIPVIAAGGVSGIEDLRALEEIPAVEGAVVGRAALEGGLDLRAAFALWG